MNYRKTKIVATIGPATSSKAMLKKIIKAGVNVCRVNFSHGNYEDHEQVIHNIREINTELGTHTAILADLKMAVNSSLPQLNVKEMPKKHTSAIRTSLKM